MFGEYCKTPKNLDTRKNCSNHPQNLIKMALPYSNTSNNADGMANSVDPDQTAPVANSVDPDQTAPVANSVDPDQTDLGLHCLPNPVCPKT